MNRLYFLIFLIFIACNRIQKIEDYQKKVILENLEGELKYFYFHDSLIEQVSETKNGKIQGRVIQFHPNGKIRRKFFINKFDDKVGDETFFDNNGIITEHTFSLTSEQLLFCAKFSNKGKLIEKDGFPYFIQGRSVAKVGDTIKFYIAAPIIPGFKTNVEFYEDSDLSTGINYINDIRQYKYRYVVNIKKNLEFDLVINIKDSLNNTVVKHKEKINVEVVE